ncbi:MAG TPA: tRNA guanosine(34) transglycosylase Tgt [Pyrinomonadaceae bacterium]|nr:tRNA guanosine(34) transglycosylase Tgt [Pyrinomonadaceae bacterium]HMP65671.1 tRNA guanosine(34) transglycosylase Tgt [Pyrinomonadaceae bacterium]
MGPIDWNIEGSDGNARAGTLKTRRSMIETPVFMPVGTQGSVKGVSFDLLENEIDARIILGNTYHLFLRPGVDVIREMGGLHRFTSWKRSFLTDSGGFQVFSLTDLRKLTEDGVEFRSHIDGSSQFLSPEISMEIQAALGSEIVMAFDECPPGDAGHEATKNSLALTIRWAERSKARFQALQKEGADAGRARDGDPLGDSSDSSKDLSGEQALFGIIQGAGHHDLRRESLERTVAIGFDGYAIGGLSVGEEKAVMYEVLENITPSMPTDAPRYLMGVGTPEDLLEAISHGVDMFDCVMPTRNGRTGGAFTSTGKLNIRNARYTRDESPLDTDCGCTVCRRYSRAYLRHLYNAGEMSAAILLSQHNLYFYLKLMKKARAAILGGGFEEFKADFIARTVENDRVPV